MGYIMDVRCDWFDAENEPEHLNMSGVERKVFLNIQEVYTLGHAVKMLESFCDVFPHIFGIEHTNIKDLVVARRLLRLIMGRGERDYIVVGRNAFFMLEKALRVANGAIISEFFTTLALREKHLSIEGLLCKFDKRFWYRDANPDTFHCDVRVKYEV